MFNKSFIQFILMILAISLLIQENASANNTSSLLPIESYSALPNKGLVRISPNGKQLAYRLTEKNKDYIVIYDLVKNKVISAFNVSDITPKSLYFLTNDKVVFVVSKYRKIGEYIGKHDVSTAFVYDMESKKLNQLLEPGNGITKGQTGLGSIVGVSKDGKWLYMPAYAGHGGGNEGTPKKSLMKVNVKYPHKTPRVFVQGTADTVDFFMDDDSHFLARERFNDEDDLHIVEVLDGEDWRVIFQQKTEYMTTRFAGVTPDFKSLVMIRQDKSDNWSYNLLSLKDGSISPSVFTTGNTDIENTFSNISRIVFGVKYSGFTPKYNFFDEKITEQLASLKVEFPTSAITLIDMTPDWKKLIIYVEGDGLSGDYLSLEKGKLAHVVSTRSHIPWESINNVVELSIKARDGLVIPTLLTIPNSATNSKEKLPTIMLPHGGPESYDTKAFSWLSQYFANRGFLVIQPQFRGSEGFGAAFTLKGRGEWGRKMQDDLTDTLQALIKMGEVDEKRVCIVGASYGGYAALAGAAFTPQLYKCVISINGISDVAQMLETEAEWGGDERQAFAYWKDVIGRNKLDEASLKSISPIHHIDKIQAPILLIHGKEDKTVLFEQSENMSKALENAGKEVVFVPLKGVRHQLKGEEERTITLQAIDKFIHQYISGLPH